MWHQQRRRQNRTKMPPKLSSRLKLNVYYDVNVISASSPSCAAVILPNLAGRLPRITLIRSGRTSLAVIAAERQHSWNSNPTSNQNTNQNFILVPSPLCKEMGLWALSSMSRELSSSKKTQTDHDDHDGDMEFAIFRVTRKEF